jgi:hypothetical protein
MVVRANQKMGRGRGSGSQVSGGGGVRKSLRITGDIKLLFLSSEKVY